ncbi:hypothetical protein GCM10009630_03770 [Kribbella jejuensis]|uniref:Uncharacterized protein n=1 Tax=Kribbella jejuensis TaxID=236068 RepID=A0A542EUR0_9ACTN|nr:hypothetical protein [Kribbella jejuensis]TQJ18916.1 hypothetical protein FB475_3070 [Kribbella jejuensis]
MDFPSFDAEYGALLDRGLSMQPIAFAVEVDRLRRLAGQVEPTASQERAHHLVAKLDKVLDNHQKSVSETVRAALHVHRRARNAKGTLPERIATIRAGIAEIGQIADSAAVEERTGILQLNESLAMLAESLEISASNTDR